MATIEQELVNQETYLALGQFVVSFSHLLHSLEVSTVQLLDLGLDHKKSLLVKAALADRTASPITSSFFSVFFEKWGELITEDDARIMKALRTEIQSLVEQRNRFMHDAWMNTTGGGKDSHPMSTMRVRAHGKGAEYVCLEMTPQNIKNLIDCTKRVTSVIYGSVWYSRPGMIGPEISDRFQIIDSKVFPKENDL